MDIRQVINDAVPVGVVGVGAVTLMGKASTFMYGLQSDEAKQEEHCAGDPHPVGMIEQGVRGKLAELTK